MAPVRDHRRAQQLLLAVDAPPPSGLQALNPCLGSRSVDYFRCYYAVPLRRCPTPKTYVDFGPRAQAEAIVADVEEMAAPALLPPAAAVLAATRSAASL